MHCASVDRPSQTARIAELEAALRRIADPAAWSFVQVDNEASYTLSQQLAEIQRIAAEPLAAEPREMSTRIFDLEAALYWYVKHVRDCEGTDFLSDGDAFDEDEPHRGIVRSFRVKQCAE